MRLGGFEIQRFAIESFAGAQHDIGPVPTCGGPVGNGGNGEVRIVGEFHCPLCRGCGSGVADHQVNVLDFGSGVDGQWRAAASGVFRPQGVLAGRYIAERKTAVGRCGCGRRWAAGMLQANGGIRDGSAACS